MPRGAKPWETVGTPVFLPLSSSKQPHGGEGKSQRVEEVETSVPRAHLPNAYNGIGDENQKDDEGLHEGSDGFLTFLKPGQHLGQGKST